MPEQPAVESQEQTQEVTDQQDFSSSFDSEPGDTDQTGVPATEAAPAQAEAPRWEVAQPDQGTPPDEETQILTELQSDGQAVIEQNLRLMEQAEAIANAQQGQVQPAPQAPPPIQQQIPQAPVDELPPEIKQFMDDYPEVAKLAEFLAQKQIAEKVSALETQFNGSLFGAARAIVELRQQVATQNFNSELLQKVPDAYGIVETKEFREWLPKQRPEVQAAFTSADARPVIKVMNLFRMQQAKQNVVSFDQAQRDKKNRVVNQHSADGERSQRRPASTDLNDFSAAFNED